MAKLYRHRKNPQAPIYLFSLVKQSLRLVNLLKHCIITFFLSCEVEEKSIMPHIKSNTLELRKGFEPLTYTLLVYCSTI